MRYYSILTKLGKIAVANAISLDTKVDFAQIGYGDGGGSEYEPSENQMELRGLKHKSKIYNIIVIEENSQIEIQGLIPSSVGGFIAREVGVYDSKGNLLIIAKIPESSKPLLEEGSGVDLYLKIRLEVSNTSIVNITVDPSALLVNINQFNQFKGEMAKEFEKFKDEVNQALAGGELEEIIINIKDDLDKHIKDSITNSDIHGMTLIDEELYRRTDKGNQAVKIDVKNIKNFTEPNVPAIATKSEAEDGTNNTKIMTPLRVKQAILSDTDGRKYITNGQTLVESCTIVGTAKIDPIGGQIFLGEHGKDGVITDNPINITEYNYLVAEHNAPTTQVRVLTSKNINGTPSAVSSSSVVINNLNRTVLSISNLSGFYYLGVRQGENSDSVKQLYLTRKHPFPNQ